MSSHANGGISTHEMIRNAIQMLSESLAQYTPDEDNMSNFKPGSLAGKIADLHVNDVHTYGRPVDPTMTVARIPDELPLLRQQVRNAVMPSVSRAKEVTGKQYKVEVGDVVMSSGSMFVVAVVTRLS